MSSARPEESFRSDLLAGQTAVITGGATGIGLALARSMVRLGGRVVIASRNAENLARAEAELAALGSAAQVTSIVTNVREAESVDRMTRHAIDRFGAIDILVNNAGANFLAPASQITPNGWRTIVDVVLTGTFLCSHAAARVMFERKRGLIINMAATNGAGGSPLMAHSGASKAGVLNLTETLAVEWARFGVRVNAVSPGPVSTDGANARLWADPQTMAKLERRVPLGRFASAEDCVGPVLFLCSPAAAFITGANLVVDGGHTLHQVPELGGE